MKQFLTFQDRSTRSEYWGVWLISTLLESLLILFGVMLWLSGTSGVVTGSIIVFVSAVMGIWMQLSVTVRRCRDAGINPWFAVAIYVPYVGLIPLIVFGCLATVNTDEVTV